MKWSIRTTITLVALVFMTTSAQTPRLSRVMREKLDHSKAILGAVVTSDWTTLDRESRALTLATHDPAWVAQLAAPEYLKQSDAFQRSLQALVEASAKRDLEAAGNAEVALTKACVDCHRHVTSRRVADTTP